jgi:aldehyde:ferredoxin oxidoreductase
MANGFWGKLLFVDLTSGECRMEGIPEERVRRTLGGGGLGAQILLEQMEPGADPLGPQNILGFLPGLLTGTGAPFSGRFMVVGRSPLTGGWGEANAGGTFGPALRAAGLDGVFIRGRAEHPVYLEIDEGRAQIRDGRGLWGLDVTETEEAVRQEAGPGTRVACIGPAGEHLSLLAGIVNDGGRIAARCGLGAVMGAKNLKAISVRGELRLPIASPELFRAASDGYLRILHRKPSPLASRIPRFLAAVLPFLRRFDLRPSSGPAGLVVDSFRRYGTAAGTAMLIELGDTPVRNWLGIGYRDFPLEKGEKLSDEAAIRKVVRPYACRACPLACGGVTQGEEGQRSHRSEYETLAAFGPLLLLDDLEVIDRCNHLCNEAGLDTISTGVAVAFALECQERGWLPEDLAAELPLRWGDGPSILELVRRITHREAGLGDWLADGVARAALQVPEEARGAAMHAGGQELPMHRGLYEPNVAAGYALDPAPGRHTSTASGMPGLAAYRPYFDLHAHRPGGRGDFEAKGKTAAIMMAVLRAYDSLGLCFFALQIGDPPFLDWLNAATGWDVDEAEFYRIGWRTQARRHLFNARQGLPSHFPLPARERGDPPPSSGPATGFTLDMDSISASYFDTLGLDPKTGLPLPDTVRRLGLDPWPVCLPVLRNAR